jgi:hypothetical protein
MIKPTIHRNGTGRDQLLEQVLEAGHKVYEALKALEAASPNGRDYYPQGPDAINTAVQEYTVRVYKLKEVWDDLQELAIHISDAEGGAR